MAKAIDAAQFTRQVADKAIGKLSAAAGVSAFGAGDVVRAGLSGAHGGTRVIRGQVVGSIADDALQLRTGRPGHHRTVTIDLASPSLMWIETIAAPGAVKARKRYGPTPYNTGWQSKKIKAAKSGWYRRRNLEVTRAVTSAIAETVAERHATIVSGLDPVTVNLAEQLSGLVDKVRDALSNERIEKLVELMLPAADPVAEVRAKIELDNAALRVRFLKDVPALTAAEVARNAGSKATNTSATANRWKSGGQIFSVVQAGREVFPAFQFDHGQPRPVVARILAVLQPHQSAWETAFWFVSSNRWLDGAAPVQSIDDEAAIVAAAERTVEDLPT